jgi:hypothetical protein
MKSALWVCLCCLLLLPNAFCLEPLPGGFAAHDNPNDAGGAIEVEFNRSSLEGIYLLVLSGTDPKSLTDHFTQPLEQAYLRALSGEDSAKLAQEYANDPIAVACLSSDAAKQYYAQYQAAKDGKKPEAYPFISGYRLSWVNWFKDALTRDVNRTQLNYEKAQKTYDTLVQLTQTESSPAMLAEKAKAEKNLATAKEIAQWFTDMLGREEAGQAEPNAEDYKHLLDDPAYARSHSSTVPILSPSEVSREGLVSKLDNDLGGGSSVLDPSKWKEEQTHIKMPIPLGRGSADMTAFVRLEVLGPDGGPLADDKGNPVGFVVGGPSQGEKVEAYSNWFNLDRLNVFISVVIFSGLVLFFIYTARKGKTLFLRRIAGMDHVEEAIGRATEMGKPILYITGLSDSSDISTIAAMTILGRVARKAAEYDTPLIVPCYDPIVMMVNQEIVKEAYTEAGRPDQYKEDNIFFVTQSQFGYVAAVDGIMMREKPATNFYMGYYFAESLILAETGAMSGAIQIAGTDAVTQLPFFITSCDYCLMGEELYAAGAYLSREPKLLGSIKGQDWSKFIAGVFILLGTLLAAAGINFIAELFITK